MELLIEKLVQYWAYPFVRYALVVGVLVALCASLLGVTLVLKRFSFIGDGLSHVAFGAMSVASVLNQINDMPLVMGISYELLKWCGRSDNIATRIIRQPGIWVQHLTVFEPDDSMIEVAIAAVTPVLSETPEEGKW